ncbi:MAG: hypothetical protein U1A78_35785 [Polyangia bacterium]
MRRAAGSVRLSVLLLAALLTAATAGHAEDPRTASETLPSALAEALGRFRAGQDQAAAESLAVLGRRAAAVDPELAAEALFRAAQIYDEHLFDLPTAQALYAELAASFPRSRFTERARQRGAVLAGLRSQGADLRLLTELEAITGAYGALGPMAVVRRLQDLLAQHPAPALAERATYLLVTAYRDAGPGSAAQAEAALGRLGALNPQSPWLAPAHQALAEQALHQSDLLRARRHFLALRVSPQPHWQQVAEQGLRRCARALLRRRAVEVSTALSVLCLAALAVYGRRYFWPVPLEVAYYLPVAAFLLLVALISRGRDLAVCRAMLLLSASGVLLCWTSAAASRRGAGLRWLAVPAAAALALGYLIFDRTGLLDLLAATLLSGPMNG